MFMKNSLWIFFLETILIFFRVLLNAFLFASEKPFHFLLKPEAYLFFYLPLSYDEAAKDFIL